MFKEWLKEKNSDPPCFCPWDSKKRTVITGLNMIASKPPGKIIGEFFFDDTYGLEIDWYEEDNFNPKFCPSCGQDMSRNHDELFKFFPIDKRQQYEFILYCKNCKYKYSIKLERTKR